VNTLEDRLRDAYRGAAETVRPEAIGNLGDQARALQHKTAWRARVMVPLAAAAAVSVIAVLAAVVVPHALPGHRRAGQAASQNRRHSTSAAPATAGTQPAFFVALDGNGGSLSVRSATTGALVTRVRAPRHGVDFGAVGTADGRTFIAGVVRSGHCRTGLYQFRLSGTGRPSSLTPFAVPELNGLLPSQTIAVSADGQTIAYSAQTCTGRTGPVPSFLAVTNVATRHTRQWAYPGQADVMSVSLSADGHLLAYNIAVTKLFASVARVLPTDAAPGTAARRSRTVAQAAQFGPQTDIITDAITADGSAVYFTTNPTGTATGTATGKGKPPAWQLHLADLTTGRSRVVATYAGWPFDLAADPSGRFLLIQSQLGSAISTPQLARLDTATGKVTYLQAAWIGGDRVAPMAW